MTLFFLAPPPISLDNSPWTEPRIERLYASNMRIHVYCTQSKYRNSFLPVTVPKIKLKKR